MVIDAISGAAYGRFNRKLAKLAGLQTACYWSELLNVITSVLKKNKYDKEGFFTLDRAYVEKQISLSLEEQLICDSSLRNLGVLDIDPADDNRLRVNLEKYLAIIIDDDTSHLKAIAKTAKVDRASKAAGKKAGVISRLQGRVVEPDEDLRALYFKLIDACYSKGLQSNAQIDLFQDTLNKYTTDKEAKAEILKISISAAYKVAEWGISVYEKNHKTSASRPTAVQVVSTGVNENIKF